MGDPPAMPGFINSKLENGVVIFKPGYVIAGAQEIFYLFFAEKFRAFQKTVSPENTFLCNDGIVQRVDGLVADDGVFAKYLHGRMKIIVFKIVDKGFAFRYDLGLIRIHRLFSRAGNNKKRHEDYVNKPGHFKGI
jgi:hypothetical protein